MAGFREATGTTDAHDLQIAIVASRFNDVIVDRLLAGATEALTRMGSEPANVKIIRVPGAWELPLAANQAAATGRFDAIIALGAVIRGETPHFDYLCAECTSALLRISLEQKLPLGFGVLTCNTAEQAQARCGENSENKGAEAAIAAVEMVQVLRRLEL